MRFWTTLSIISMAAAAFLSTPIASAPTKIPLYQQFLSPASPQEVVAARKADRVAWVDYAEGKRNAYTAAAPLFTPVRLTNFMKDDGIMMSGIRISDDGSTVVFLRGEAPEPRGLVAQSHRRPQRAGTRHLGGAHQRRRRRVAGGRRHQPELAPDGSAILFVKDGQILSRETSRP